MTIHSFTFTILREFLGSDGEEEIDVDIDYTYTPGTPEQGQSYACGGQPAEPPEVNIQSVTFAGETMPLTDQEIERFYELACREHAE